jgi:hypothetical protein
MIPTPVEVLEKYGPMLSSDVAAALVERVRISPAAARQRVSRAHGEVKTLAGLSFRRNARFLYLRQHYGSPKFWSALIAALMTSNGAYARALEAIQQRDGILPLAHFGIAVGAPLRQSKQLSPALIYKRLVEIGLLQELSVPSIGQCLAFAKTAPYLDTIVPRMKARLIAERVLLTGVHQWARTLNLGSYNTFQLRDGSADQPQVSGYQWDITAPSYLAPLVKKEAGARSKPGFVVFDVLLTQGKVSTAGIAPFLHKCDALRLRSASRCLPFFIADDYTLEAIHSLRQQGIVPASPMSLFGRDVATALRELVATLTQAARAVVDPLKFAALFEKLSVIEGAASALRGSLFEFVVADIMRREFNARVTMNKICREAGEDAAEIDVLGVVENKAVYFVECKGHAPGVSVSDIDVGRWLDTRIPIVRRWALRQEELRHLELHFELWTSGSMSVETRARIAEAKNEVSPTKYVIGLREASEIETLAGNTRSKALLNVVRRHFSHHPLAKLI